MISVFFSRNRMLFLHTTFWLVYFGYRVFDIQKYIGLQKALVIVALPMFFNLIISYVHYFLILPSWIQKKETLLYSIRLLLLLIFFIPIRMYAESLVMGSLSLNPEYYQTITVSRLVSIIWDTLVFVVFIGMIRFTVNWFELENKKKQLENEKLVAELNYLKAQINPHFLFNTLHNLNYLVYAGSKKATDVIIKLSNIMRYMIYDANKDFVLLQREIEYMNDYIALESIRLNQTFVLDFNIHGNVSDIKIAPLVLITFLENAFKHGVSDQEENCWVKVDLYINDSFIQFDVANKKLKLINNKLRSGFGLENVTKRLMLSYPDRHKLVVTEDDKEYKVNLVLER